MAKRGLKLRDVVLSIICVVFTIEACAPAASIGNSSVFWWLFLLIAFLMPYGLVVAELGTTYAEGAGVYEWVRDGMGSRWAAREAWYYWINYTTWLASITLLFPTTINGILGFEMPLWLQIAIELAFIWFVVYTSAQEVTDTSWIMNAGAVLNIVIAVGIVWMAIDYGLTHGFANPITPQSMLPDFSDPNAVSYLSVIIYNYLGCEVIATFVDSMDNPKTDMPKAIITGGLVIVAIYLAMSLGISAAVPSNLINLDSGIADAVAIMAGEGSLPYVLVSIGFLLSLFANMVSWSSGVSSVTNQAGKELNLPAVFGIESRERHLHVGSCVMNGVMASVLVLLEPVFDALGIDAFWIVFSLDVTFTLAAYLLMFPAFLRLRKKDPNRARPFRCPGGKVVTQLFCWVPVVLLAVAIAVAVIPLNGSADEMSKIPLLIATAVVIAIGEFVPALSRLGRGKAA